jgi:HPt (histidine-containing phosphotransfer) domain-containing protein
MCEAQEKCIEAGMDDYLSKPFSLNSLKEKVVKWARVERKSHGLRELGASTLKNVEKTTETQGKKASDSDLNADSAVLDQNVLAGLKTLQAQGSSDMFARVIKLYLDSTRELVEALQAACYANEHEKIGQYAHALKSSSTNVGAMRLSAYLAELEARAREKMLEDVEERLANIMREYSLVVAALREEVSD